MAFLIPTQSIAQAEASVPESQTARKNTALENLPLKSGITFILPWIMKD